MTVKEQLEAVVRDLPEERVREVLRFAEILAARPEDDLDAWREALRHSFAGRYGDDEPEYTYADIKRR